MVVLSKYIDLAVQKYDESRLSKTSISNVIIGAAICAYTFKLTYSLIGNNHINMEEQQHTYKRNNATLYTDLDEDVSITPTDDEDSKFAEVEKLLVAKQLKRHNNAQLEPGLNKEFIQQISKLLKIMIPKCVCYETGLLIVHTLCLISRTFLSIYVAALEGAIVKFIVRKDVKQFGIILLKWFGIAIPATFINSMIRFLESKLSLSFSTTIVCG
ncbi:ATP-binding cassette sub-family D member 1-like [Anastrepha obliqua]|uniref:ATP-binding cassette sub-family D member 1-like n=1 Tax=Anastrepha obliqua TaxID=95512 RepID=UPI0024090B51|nr:ATP-binding cassette sub-family D member 1-like [Anastrepha obliqua]